MISSKFLITKNILYNSTRSFWRLVKNPTPMSDLVFKNIFGRESNINLLRSLINSVVSSDDQIDTLNHINTYKASAVDVKAIGLDGKRFAIDVQVENKKNYIPRAAFYSLILNSEQLLSKKGYSEFNKSISIHFVDFKVLDDRFSYHSKLLTAEKNSGLFLPSQYSEIHLIELPKYVIKTDQPIESAKEAWCAFFKDYKKISSGRVTIASEEINYEIRNAIEIFEAFIKSAEYRALVDVIAKARISRLARIQSKVDKSKMEQKKKFAKIMFNLKKFNITEIEEYTGLSREILEEIQKETSDGSKE